MAAFPGRDRRGDHPAGGRLERRVGDLTRVISHRAGSAASVLAAGDVLPALDPPPRIPHVTSITPALGPGPAEAVGAVGEAGLRICLDANHRTALRDQGREAALSVVIASEDELEPIAPASATTERDRVSALLDAGVSATWW